MPLINGKFGDVDIPAKHRRILTDKSKPYRFRSLWGGRNGAKDWSIAIQAVEIAVRSSARFLFTREVQKTLAASAHQLIEDTINRLGYHEYFDIGKELIRGRQHESMFRFTGLNDLVAGDLKSIEGMDYAVICEAENLTKKSFDILNYTIRKETSEIWIQFNPRYADDFVCEFCINNPPENMIGARVNGFALTEDGRVVRADNPHVSDSQLVEAMRMLRTDRRAFDNQCLGIPLGQGGRILPMYDPDVHDIDFDLDRLSQCNLFMAIDPHRKYYPAILWFAITPSASVVVYNEYPKYSDLGMYYDEARDIVPFDLDLKELSNVILANDMNLKSKLPVVRTGDPRFLTEFPDMTRVLGEHGVVGWVDAPHELIETQREHLKALLNWNPALPFAGMNTPQFYVARGENTRNVRRALMRHCWSEDKDKESEKYKDFIDAIRYFLSILNGQVRYVSSAQGRTGIPLKSLSSVMLETMPASGYFQQKRPA